MSNNPERTVSENTPEMNELVRECSELFINRWDIYAFQQHDGSYYCVHQPLTAHLIQQHLTKRITIGAYALDSENRGKWLVFDADDQEKWEKLKALSERLQQRAIPSFLELSRRGGHLWLFFKESLRGRTLLALGKALASSAQVQVEVFPKGEHEEGPGSLVRLPFGIHQRADHRYSFINPDGNDLSRSVREQLAILGQAPKVPTVFVADTLVEMAQIERVGTRLIPNEPKLDDKLAQMDIYEFVAQYIELTPNGRGHCPFHPDTHMSFSVNRKENYWNCFAGCGGGDIVAFWAKKRGISRAEAYRELQDG